ncbi:MAG: hypothetical protein V6Z89_06330 [Desulfobacter sp.]
MVKKKDVMDSILAGDDAEFAGKTRELDCLIYRTGDQESIPPADESISPSSWKAAKGNVSVEIWEGRAKIKISIGSGSFGQVSMKRLASIAVDAILAELEKEE